MELLIQFLKRCYFFISTFHELEPIEVANILMNGGKIVLLKRTNDDLTTIYEILVEFCGRKFDVSHTYNIKYYIKQQLIQNWDSHAQQRLNDIEYIHRIVNEETAKLVCSMAEKDINVTFGSQSTRVDICKEAFIIDNNDLISPAMLKTLLLLAYKAGQDEVENRSCHCRGPEKKSKQTNMGNI